MKSFLNIYGSVSNMHRHWKFYQAWSSYLNILACTCTLYTWCAWCNVCHDVHGAMCAMVHVQWCTGCNVCFILSNTPSRVQWRCLDKEDGLWKQSVFYVHLCAMCTLCSSVVLDSDGSVDDPDAPNQITEGIRRQPPALYIRLSFCAVVAEVNALRFLHQPPTRPYCSGWRW